MFDEGLKFAYVIGKISVSRNGQKDNRKSNILNKTRKDSMRIEKPI